MSQEAKKAIEGGGSAAPFDACTPGSSDDEEVKVLPELWPLKFE